MSTKSEPPSVCRLCAEQLVEDTAIFLFGETGLQCNIGDIIFEHFDVAIRPTDQHSKHICSSCWTVTSNFHELFERVQRTEGRWALADGLVKTEITVQEPSGAEHVDDNHPADDDHQTDNESTNDQPGDVDFPAQPSDDSDTESNASVGGRKKRLRAAKTATTQQATEPACDEDKTPSGQITNKLPPAHCCDMCDEIFSRPTQLSHHRRKVHDEPKSNAKKFRCDVCEKFFVNKYVLATHVRAVHENAFAHMCHVCAKTFKSKHVFELHQREHLDHDIPKLQCNICGNWLKHEHSLRKHIARHFQTQQTCKLCGKQVPNVHALGNHMRYVHSERVYKCTMCEKAFKKSIELKEHMAAHTGVDLYTCPYCPQAFKSSANMYSHRKKRHLQQWQQDREQRLK